jgi:hypothetical protein
VAFEILGATNTREVRGNKLVKVREFAVVSLPSETYFQFRRDASQPCYAAPKPCAKQFSDRIEAVMGLADVTDVVYSQDTTSGGKLVDWITTFYETADGKIAGSVESTLAQFGPNFTGAQVAAEIARGGDLVGA